MSAASAGCGGHGGFHGIQSKAHNQQALQQSRARKAAQARAVAAAKQKKAIQQARAEKAEAAKVAVVEPAPAAEETNTVAESPESTDDKITVASAEQTCTRFNAQIGTTVTTDCAKQ
jgi:hypothetical protein